MRKPKECRKKSLLNQIEEENKDLHRLEKLLNFNKRKNKKCIPKSLCDMGLDYLLEVVATKPKEKHEDTDINNSDTEGLKDVLNKKKAINSESKSDIRQKGKKSVRFSDQLSGTINDIDEKRNTDESNSIPTLSDVAMKKKLKYAKKRKRKRQVQREKRMGTIEKSQSEDAVCQSDREELIKKRKLIEVEDNKQIYGDQSESERYPTTDGVTLDVEASSVRKQIRRQLNRLSESEMMKVLNDIYAIFVSHPRAIVREIIANEVFLTLENSLGNGWLEIELAAFLAALDCNLQHEQSQSHLAAHVIETILTHSAINHESTVLFLTFVYMFGVITSDLIVEILCELADSHDVKNLKSIKSVLKVSYHSLKKYSQQSMNQLNETLQSRYDTLSEDMVDLEIEYEDILSIFSQKRSCDSLSTRCDHLKKQMKLWVKGKSKSTSRLPLHLKELREAKTSGHRWWVVGSAYRPDTESTVTEELHEADPACVPVSVSTDEDEKINHVAERLGLKTESRRSMFRSLVSADSPEEAVYLLARLTQLSGNDSGPGASTKHSTSRIKEQEVVRIIFRALIAEKSYNSFYARVLAGLCKHHRKYKMMVKCCIWDLMSKSGQSVDRKIKYGKVAAYLVLNHHCSINLLVKFDFRDKSSDNVAFLCSFLQDLVQSSVNKVDDLTALIKRLYSKAPNQTKKLFQFIGDRESQESSSILTHKNCQLINKILQNCVDF